MSSTQANKSHPRWEGFDHLRGLAAVAVVVLHGAYAYSFDPLVGLLWPVPLDEPNRLADILFWASEGCVMPIFFLMSGFFLAQSLRGKRPGQVFASRSRRLLLPMAVIGVPVLFVDLYIWGFGLLQMGQVSMSQYLWIQYPLEIRADLFGPAHLWYVEYLWIMIAGVCLLWGLAGGISQRRREDDDRSPRATLPLAEKKSGMRTLPLLGLIALVGAITAILAWEPAIVIGFQHGWLPAGPKFFHGLCFLLLGMVGHGTAGLLDGLKRRAGSLLAGAAGLLCLLVPMSHQALARGDGTAFNLTLGLVLSGYALLASAGALGGCLRWLETPNRLLGGLGAASFWIYIVHHPLLGVAHLGLRPLPIPSVAKFLIATGGTLAICLVTWRYLVRDGALGQILAGRWPWTWTGSEPTILAPAAAGSSELEAVERRRRAA